MFLSVSQCFKAYICNTYDSCSLYANSMIIYIKNMVCNRCKKAVKELFEQMGYEARLVELGEVDITEELKAEDKELLKTNLLDLGFELIDDKKSRLIEQIKNVIIDLVHKKNVELKENMSNLLRDKLHHDYHYLSNLFSEVEGITIEKYFIAQKIEKVKELLIYDELTLSEIAIQLNYSSVAYLSSQFKSVTGITPTVFKQMRGSKRKPLDEV